MNIKKIKKIKTQHCRTAGVCVVSGALRCFQLQGGEDLFSNGVELAYTRTFVISRRDFSSRLYPMGRVAVSLMLSYLHPVSSKCWFSVPLGSKMAAAAQVPDVQRKPWDHFFLILLFQEEMTLFQVLVTQDTLISQLSRTHARHVELLWLV